MKSKIPLLMGGFFLLTAALKSFHVVDAATLQVSHELPQWVVVAGVQVEVIVGLLLISGWKPRLVWAMSLSLLLGFTIFSAYRALVGYDSCGCFGPLKVNPWWTLTLDVGLLLLLVQQRPAFVERDGIFGKSALVAGSAIYIMLGGLSFLLEDDLWTIRDRNAVILNPNEWIGHDFPLRNVISPQTDLSKNEWIVLMYHHDCVECKQALPQYGRLAEEFAEQCAMSRVLLIEVPPLGEESGRAGEALYAQLSTDKDWFVQAPVEIQLRDGKVTLASYELPSISSVP
jgi:hypothetical protein